MSKQKQLVPGMTQSVLPTTTGSETSHCTFLITKHGIRKPTVRRLPYLAMTWGWSSEGCPCTSKGRRWRFPGFCSRVLGFVFFGRVRIGLGCPHAPRLSTSRPGKGPNVRVLCRPPLPTSTGTALDKHGDEGVMPSVKCTWSRPTSDPSFGIEGQCRQWRRALPCRPWTAGAKEVADLLRMAAQKECGMVVDSSHGCVAVPPQFSGFGVRVSVSPHNATESWERKQFFRPEPPCAGLHKHLCV